jgi:hypothetical protein
MRKDLTVREMARLGGKASARALTPEQRTAKARKAGLARAAKARKAAAKGKGGRR